MKDPFYYFYLLIVLCLSINCQEKSANRQETIEFDFSKVPKKTTLWLENFSLSKYNIRDITISPIEDQILFTIVSLKNTLSAIVEIKKNTTGWSSPKITSFSGQYSDLEPFFHPDGSRLFFASNRPVDTPAVIKDFDIWVVEKTSSGWGTPENLSDPINTEANEFYPSVGANSNLYFTANYNDGIGTEDIYLSRFEKGKYQNPVLLDSTINSRTYEFNAFINPTEDLILFSSYGRPDDLGGGDLYFSRKNEAGMWPQAIHLDSTINSTALDYCPFVWADTILFFTSDKTNIKKQYPAHLNLTTFLEYLENPMNGSGNIYWRHWDIP